MYQKIKGIIEDDAVFYSLLILLVGMASFGLGRLSLADAQNIDQSASVTLSQPAPNTPETANTVPAHNQNSTVNGTKEHTSEVVPGAAINAAFVASKNGTKYHRLDCPGAKQMAETNKIFFASVDEAQSSGYSPAANCPGL